MAAITETTSNVTEFSGNYKVVVVELDGATETTGTLRIDELGTVVAAFGQLKEAPTADCAHIRVSTTATTSTILSVIMYEDDHVTQCTQNATDSYILAIGY